MQKKISILFILFFIGVRSIAQDSSLLNSSWADSLRSAIQDSVRKNKTAATHKNITPVLPKDSLAGLRKKDSTQTITFNDSLYRNVINDTAHQTTVSDSASLVIIKTRDDSIVKAQSKIKKSIPDQKGISGMQRNLVDTDLIFYVLIFITFFLALIKRSFPKYFNSIFSLSFQATFRQIQTREQMSQNFFPAFMLNVLFILSGGLFITLIAQFYKWIAIPFWQLFIYSTTILGIIYIVKYFVIFITGWVFNAADAAAEYRFIVFLINKLVGILFLPILFIIAYTNDDIKKIAITIALCIAGLLIAVRYLISIARIRRNLNLPAFHFFIYLCAVEIMPLLVIYKLLFIKTGNT